VAQLDSGSPGRGTRLQLDDGIWKQQWRVLYWLPEQRIDFELGKAGRRIGYSFTLEPGADAEHTLVGLALEFRFSGARRWLAPLLAMKEKRRAARLFRQMCKMLQQQAG
jgi:hypothetical protein